MIKYLNVTACRTTFKLLILKLNGWKNAFKSNSYWSSFIIRFLKFYQKSIVVFFSDDTL